MGWGWGWRAQTRARAVLVLFWWSSGRKGGAAGRDSGVASRLNRAEHRAQAACTVRGPQHCTGATALCIATAYSVNIRPNGHPRWRPPRPPYYAASCCPLKSHRAKNVLFRADYSGQLSSEQGGEGVTDQGRMLAAGPPLRCNVARHSAADSVRDAPSGGWRAETRCKL